LVITWLEKQGADIQKALLGLSDKEVATKAKSEKRILLTFDKHFSNILAYPPEEFFGIIRIRIRPPFIKTVINSLSNLFKSPRVTKLKGKLIILEATGFRIKEPK